MVRERASMLRYTLRTYIACLVYLTLRRSLQNLNLRYAQRWWASDIAAFAGGGGSDSVHTHTHTHTHTLVRLF
jgi:hypothetical protein